MTAILIRIGLAVVFIVIIALNTIYPAFRKDLPLFWMFKGRKIREKYKEEFERVQEQEIEKHIVDELDQRIQNLKGE